jgi:FMN-dependent NADH-azoreductase
LVHGIVCIGNESNNNNQHKERNMRILHLDTSAKVHGSHSRAISQQIVAKIVASGPKATVIRRDLGLETVPHLSEASLNAFFQDKSSWDEAAAKCSDFSMMLIEEVRQCDVVVLGVPMYNFGIPSALKAYIDHIVRVNETFQFTAAGPVGLLQGKQVIAGITRGGSYSGSSSNHQETYLKTVLSFIGIEDVTFLVAENLAVPELAQRSLEEVRNAIEDLMMSAVLNPVT